MLEIGQEPVSLSREIDGFVLNRIQWEKYYLLAYASRLKTVDVKYFKQ